MSNERDNNSRGHQALELEALCADVAFIKSAVVQIMDELAALTRLVQGGRGEEETEGGKHKDDEKEPSNIPVEPAKKAAVVEKRGEEGRGDEEVTEKLMTCYNATSKKDNGNHKNNKSNNNKDSSENNNNNINNINNNNRPNSRMRLNPFCEQQVPELNLHHFCTMEVPDFTPLGGSRPDAAVVACVAVWEEEEEEAKEDVILPPDVLDTTLAMLCSPPIIQHVSDLREAHFKCHTATIRLCTADEEVEIALWEMTKHMPRGGLSVTVVLGQAVTDLRDRFFDEKLGRRWTALGRIDFRRTLLQRIDSEFLNDCDSLTTVSLPRSLTEVGDLFLARCTSLRSVDMGRTALQTVGEFFAARCSSLTTVVLPDTVTEVGDFMLEWCDRVEVRSGSTAVQDARRRMGTQQRVWQYLNSDTGHNGCAEGVNDEFDSD